MDNVRPRASYSPIKRSYYTRPAVRPKDLKQDVKTSGVKNMTTAGTRAVVNTGKGKMDNDLKKSRWVWRPKGNYMDHESKEKGSFILKKFEYGNPEICLQDHAVVDSGCSSHMTGNKAYLLDYEDYNGGFVAFGSDPKGGKITGKGKIRTANLDFDDVYFVDELNFKLLDENQVVLRAPRQNGVYSLDLKNIVPSGAKKGIKREFSVARTPQQNGVAERKNRTLIEAARTMLADSLLPIPFWAEAVNTACYVLNKAFRVYNKRTKRVEENMHIDFLEDQPNVAGSGPDWMPSVSTSNSPLVSTANTPYASAASTPTGANTGGFIIYLSWRKYPMMHLLSQCRFTIDPNNHEHRKMILMYIQMKAYFSGVYNDEDVVQRLISTIWITPLDVTSLFPTLRVHKDHPKGQILGDPKSAVQTRGKIQKASSVQQALVSYISNQNRTNHKDYQNFSMPNLEFVDQHNMVACLEMTDGNSDFHEIMDFLASSLIHHALIINATVDSKAIVVTEASIRSSLLFNDVYPTPAHNLKVFSNMSRKGVKFSGKVTPLFDSMLVPHQAPEGEGSEQPTEPQPTPSLTQPNTGDQPPETSSSHATTQDSKDSLEGTNGNEGDQVQTPHDSPLLGGHTSDRAEEISALKSRIKKLEKKCKPSISHHKAWLKSDKRLSMKKRFGKKESISKQGRKKAKLESTLDDSTVFDDQDADHGMEYMETEEAMDKVRQSGEIEEVKLTDDTKVVEDKSSGDKEGNVEELVSTARPDIDAARQEDSDVEPRTPPTKTNVDDSSRPARSILTLKPLPTIDPKDKGKGVLKESPVKKVKRSKYRHNQLNKKIFEEIQALYIKEQERNADFVLIGSERDEKMIDKMNKKVAGREENIRKRSGRRLKMKDTKKSKSQKTDSNLKEEEQLRASIKIVPDEEEEIDYEVLGTRRYLLIRETLERMMELRLIAESEGEAVLDLFRFIQK
ncbi:copia protein [Tanacetum coccineum]|uniref:Copia protein n=1 Tax=Tanacetum coccineum TaxID=301880 RepID=A0ABQ5FAJ5_9ASTR